MHQLQKDLQAVTKELKRLAQKTEKIIKQFERLEKVQAAKEPKTKKAKEVTEIDPILARIMRDKICPTDIVLAHIIGSRDGIDLATLKKKTGFKYHTVKQIIYMLKKQGKIKSKRKAGLRGAAYSAGGSLSLHLEAAIPKKPTRVSSRDTVLAIIKRSRKGVDKATLIKNTGFEDKNIRDITYRLRKQGKIERDLKGLYVKA